jgi:hypothetical protein
MVVCYFDWNSNRDDKKGRAAGGKSKLLHLNEKVKHLVVFRVDDLAILANELAEHFPITVRNGLHRASLLGHHLCAVCPSEGRPEDLLSEGQPDEAS